MDYQKGLMKIKRLEFYCFDAFEGKVSPNENGRGRHCTESHEKFDTIKIFAWIFFSVNQFI